MRLHQLKKQRKGKMLASFIVNKKSMIKMDIMMERIDLTMEEAVEGTQRVAIAVAVILVVVLRRRRLTN